MSVAMAMRSPLEAVGAGPRWRGGRGSSVAMQFSAELVVRADAADPRRRRADQACRIFDARAGSSSDLLSRLLPSCRCCRTQPNTCGVEFSFVNTDG
eukprot:scaffold424_cov69-Phaeocystis_antarctica.AAC.3